eukprot:gnl/TRDRNA2_/TRDRNA2_190091_c0_seq1.p2 gnl/TRDRNA2_/TRDRNA2_190091_c0~~gnl/TRDRNA2_/TRDRNA2_190091_c0_seq1.p2  ORF type:complete len:220 (+),score=49.60 gnl/TRDRNA2_/TRDRNA2_190091_c0_seq1:102-761(+)
MAIGIVAITFLTIYASEASIEVEEVNDEQLNELASRGLTAFDVQVDSTGFDVTMLGKINSAPSPLPLPTCCSCSACNGCSLGLTGRRLKGGYPKGLSKAITASRREKYLDKLAGVQLSRLETVNNKKAKKTKRLKMYEKQILTNKTFRKLIGIGRKLPKYFKLKAEREARQNGKYLKKKSDCCDVCAKEPAPSKKKGKSNVNVNATVDMDVENKVGGPA